MASLSDFRKAKDDFFASHPNSPLTPVQKADFNGLNYFPENPALRLEIDVEPFGEQELVQMPTSTGEVKTYTRYARFGFEAEGKAAELTLYNSPSGLFLLFVDSMAGTETYGAGRYLEPEELPNGKILVDFNLAYNPYCAYNEMWSCPIPPAENRLAVPIRAGEKEFRIAPMTKSSQIIIVGGGTFGVNTALELNSRGYGVTLLDPGPLPHPHAASTDISKVIRMDYGRDEFYMEMMEEALDLWRHWNTELGETVFYETGVLYLARATMQPGGFERDSYDLLLKRGHSVDRLNSAAIAKRFPAWNSDLYEDGYFNPQGGWSPSGKVVNLLAKRAIEAGVKITEGASFAALIEEGGQVRGVKTTDGAEYRGDHVIVCAGSWTPLLLPSMQDVMWPTAQPVMHFKAADVESYQPPGFPVWTADVGNTGWYGFPAQDDGTLKLANHGPGWRKDPLGDRSMPADVEPRFRAFFAESLPGLADAPKVGERLCFYCDTFDGNFWIDNDPDRPGLLVSAGGSGHAFKFTPLIGRVTADVLEGKPNRYAARFAWRERGELKAEEARNAGEGIRK